MSRQLALGQPGPPAVAEQATTAVETAAIAVARAAMVVAAAAVLATAEQGQMTVAALAIPRTEATAGTRVRTLRSSPMNRNC